MVLDEEVHLRFFLRRKLQPPRRAIQRREAPGYMILDRHALALEHPVDGVACAGPGADIDLVRTERGEARNRQPGPLALGSLRLVAGMRAAATILDGFLDEALAARGLDERSLALVETGERSWKLNHWRP